MYILSTQDTVNFKSIRIKKPYYVHGKLVYNIFYENDPLLCQTPISSIAYNYMVFDNKYFQIDIEISQKEFIDKITSIMQNICQRLKIKDKIIKDGIRLIPKTDTHLLRLRNENVDSIKVFNNDKQNIDIKNLSRLDRIIAIFQFDKVIVDDQQVTFHLNAIQFKKLWLNCDTVSNECMVVAEDFSKYDKMLSYGIPLEAVKQKMLLESISLIDIDKFIQRKAKPCISPPQPPPPPPPPTFSNNKISNNKPMLAFIGDIKAGNFKLKSCVVNEEEKKKTIINKILRNVDQNKYSPPSLEAIIAAKNNLRKV